MKPITFYIPGPAEPKPRQKFRILYKNPEAGQNPTELKKPFVSAYEAATTYDKKLKKWIKTPYTIFKEKAKQVAKANYHGDLIGKTPVQVDICFLFDRQSAKIWKTKEMPEYWHTERPDRDNLEKAILDIFTGIVFKDDGIVCLGEVTKIRAPAGLDSCTVIRISDAPECKIPKWAMTTILNERVF